VIHLWVEGFFEVFATVVIAIYVVNWDSSKILGFACDFYLTTILYLGSGDWNIAPSVLFGNNRLLLQQWERSFSLGSGSPDADWFRGVEDAETLRKQKDFTVGRYAFFIATCFGI